MGRSSQVIAPTKKGWLLTVREPPDESSVMRVRVPLRSPVSAAPLAHLSYRHAAYVVLRSDQTASGICIGDPGDAGYSRSSTAREQPESIREMWVRFPSGAPFLTGR